MVQFEADENWNMTADARSCGVPTLSSGCRLLNGSLALSNWSTGNTFFEQVAW